VASLAVMAKSSAAATTTDHKPFNVFDRVIFIS
jgi:hypothetical protein